MSVKITSWVWEFSSHKGSELLVLLALADAANQEGVCWPKISTLASMTRLSERTIQRILRELEMSGELKTLVGGFLDGRNQSSTYIVTMGRQAVTPSNVTPGATPVDATVVTPRGITEEPPVEPSSEPSTTSCDGGAAAATSLDGPPQLPGMPPAPAPHPAPSPSKSRVRLTPEIQEVWDYYLRTFGDRIQLKELTEPRLRTLAGAMRAVNDNVGLLKQAIDGLKSYRERQGDDGKRRAVNMDTIFKTNPRDQTGLTEKIEWWASHAKGGNTDIPSSVPSAHRSRVMELAVAVLGAERRPDDASAKVRAEEAKQVLTERFKLKVLSDGHGKLAGWGAA